MRPVSVRVLWKNDRYEILSFVFLCGSFIAIVLLYSSPLDVSFSRCYRSTMVFYSLVFSRLSYLWVKFDRIRVFKCFVFLDVLTDVPEFVGSPGLLRSRGETKGDGTEASVWMQGVGSGGGLGPNMGGSKVSLPFSRRERL